MPIALPEVESGAFLRDVELIAMEMNQPPPVKPYKPIHKKNRSKVEKT